jgi:hypothetical protein
MDMIQNQQLNCRSIRAKAVHTSHEAKRDVGPASTSLHCYYHAGAVPPTAQVPSPVHALVGRFVHECTVERGAAMEAADFADFSQKMASSAREITGTSLIKNRFNKDGMTSTRGQSNAFLSCLRALNNGPSQPPRSQDRHQQHAAGFTEQTWSVGGEYWQLVTDHRRPYLQKKLVGITFLSALKQICRLRSEEHSAKFIGASSGLLGFVRQAMLVLKQQNKTLKQALTNFMFCGDGHGESPEGSHSFQRFVSVEFMDILNAVKEGGLCLLRGSLELKQASLPGKCMVECTFSCTLWKGFKNEKEVTLGMIQFQEQHTIALCRNAKLKSDLGMPDIKPLGPNHSKLVVK